jgi:hypothetical protein
VSFGSQEADGVSLLNSSGNQYIAVSGKKYIKVYSNKAGEACCYYPEKGSYIMDFCTGDINGDKYDEIIMLTARDNQEYGNDFLVF